MQPNTSMRPFNLDHLPGGSRIKLSSFAVEGRPWFIASEVCKVLGLRKAALDRLDSGQKDSRNVHTSEGPQCMTLINEAGLYSLIFASTKGPAVTLKKWAASFVLPCVRKRGGYVNGLEALDQHERREHMHNLQVMARQVRK